MSVETKQLTETETEKQNLGARLVEREVIYCVSNLIHECSKTEAFGEELYDLQIQDDWESPALWDARNDTSEEEALDILEYFNLESNGGTDSNQLIEALNEEEIDAQEYCEYRNIDPEVIEVYEHWIVSDWLKGKLEEKDQITGYFKGLPIWGRCATGQAIMLDRVIQEIAIETYYND